MSVANERQVGGEHYRSTYQHWDFIANCQLPYLIGCATKYICRAYKKNGREDLDKALHYVEKIKERFLAKLDRNERFSQESNRKERLYQIMMFCEENSLNALQTEGIMRLCTWETPADLDAVTVAIKDLINTLS